MRREILIQNGGLPKYLLWMFSLIAGLTIANNYYSQSLLGLIQIEFGVSALAANMVSMLTQAGYAVGLLFIVPLGDMVRARKIVFMLFAILVAALFGTYFAPNIAVLLIALFVMGLSTVVPQIFVPLTSQLSEPEKKGKNVSIVLAGLLSGIMVSRVISGYMGEFFGWRTIYLVAGIAMFVLMVLLYFAMPDVMPSYRGRYSKLLRSIVRLVREEPRLMFATLKASFAFATFLAFWSVLAFKLSEPPLFAGAHIVGLLSLFGLIGVFVSTSASGYLQRVGVIRANYVGVVLGAVLLF